MACFANCLDCVYCYAHRKMTNDAAYTFAIECYNNEKNDSRGAIDGCGCDKFTPKGVRADETKRDPEYIRKVIDCLELNKDKLAGLFR